MSRMGKIDWLWFDHEQGFAAYIYIVCNATIYNSELDVAHTKILHGPTPKDEDAIAFFCPSESNKKIKQYIGFKYIEFWEAIDKVGKTQRDKLALLIMYVLHEMAHQYCYEKGIDDAGHNEAWQKVANEHGLFVNYKNDERTEEGLSVEGMGLFDVIWKVVHKKTFENDLTELCNKMENKTEAEEPR